MCFKEARGKLMRLELQHPLVMKLRHQKTQHTNQPTHTTKPVLIALLVNARSYVTALLCNFRVRSQQHYNMSEYKGSNLAVKALGKNTKDPTEFSVWVCPCLPVSAGKSLRA